MTKLTRLALAILFVIAYKMFFAWFESTGDYSNATYALVGALSLGFYQFIIATVKYWRKDNE